MNPELFNMLPEIKTYQLKAELQPLPENYPISAKVIADSFSPLRGTRLTTLELQFPRYVLAEFNTHRVFSRNTSSSRAIPVGKQATTLEQQIVEPVRWGKNQPGMQASRENLSGEDLKKAKSIWREMAQACIDGCRQLSELGLHKQWANRPLEWFSTSKVVVSATDWDNFFLLRDHGDAQDEIAHLSQHIKLAMNASTPQILQPGQWHIPYVTEEEFGKLTLVQALKVSASRCARVSYKTQHGVTSTLGEDLAMFKRLTYGMESGFTEENPFHASPTEHQATPFFNFWSEISLGSNFSGWRQARRCIEQGTFEGLKAPA